MPLKNGRNINSRDIANVRRVEINSVTATVIALANERIHFSVCLEPDDTDVNVAVRLYPALVDDLKVGEILTRHTLGNQNLFRPSWTMTPDNMYHGEISAISDTGEFYVYVTEY